MYLIVRIRGEVGLRNAFGESQCVLWRFQCKWLSGERSCIARTIRDALRTGYKQKTVVKARASRWGSLPAH